MSHKVQALILDASPLITQPATQLQQFADEFFTTPGVYNELKDEQARHQLIVWGDKLKVRHPKKESIAAVIAFAKLTGDSHVLSQNDIHIIALAYEIDIEKNNGVNRLRKFPGEVRPEDKERLEKEKKEKEERIKARAASTIIENKEDDVAVEEDDGFQIVTNKKWTRKHKPSPQPVIAETEKIEKEETAKEGKDESTNKEEDLEAEYDDDDDDGEWITPDNIVEVMYKEENGEEIEAEKDLETKIPAALASGDFAVQNVTLQLGLNLMNSHSGMQIKRVRNYMLRCHACFKLVPIPKDSTPRHFCPSCGGPTLRRIAVSVNSQTGEITPHLKKNFQWRTRGNIYSMPSPVSKKSTKKYGNKGYQHRGNERMNNEFFTEDQREYQQAIKTAKWQQRQNEKAYEDFVGGGSADNCISPFFIGADIKPVNVKVGRGRFANQSRKKK